jgi:hypothetical protein
MYSRNAKKQFASWIRSGVELILIGLLTKKNKSTMYLTGTLDRRDYFSIDVKFKNEITREDLVKTKQDNSYQVIDVNNKKYFDPDTNGWKDIRVE